MFATQLLPETPSDDLEEESHTVVGFIVVNDQKHEVKKGETKIGRDSSVCSIAIENFTVSKVHAVIESDGIDDTFIYDVGSTNQTKLGKKVLKPHCRYKLDNNSSITLGSIIVKFILPPDKDLDVIPDKTSKENCNTLDEYGDIFEVATQANLPLSNMSRKIAFANQSENFETFKIPNTQTKNSPEQSKSIFDFETQCRLNLQETISETKNHNSLQDYSEIFSLSTQCQIYESEIVREDGCKVNSVQEVDELKSFLNDGQDDVLCAVVSLQSSKEVCNDEVEKKLKTEIDNLSQILDAPTQIQADVIESQEEKSTELNCLSEGKDFSTTTSCLPITASTPLNSRLKVNNSANNSCPQPILEDFIKTQEFRISELHEKCQPDNLSQDVVILPYLGRSLTDNSMIEQKSHDEDFILTQSFEAPEGNPLNKESSIVIPESEDFSEDFMETQIYDIESEKKAVEQVKTKTRPTLSHDATAEFTQQNKEEDFIATQLFKETDEGRRIDGNYEKNALSDDDFVLTQEFKELTEAKRTGGNLEKNAPSDDEDFITTQAFKEPVEPKKIDGNCEKNVPSDDEDFIATQVPELSKKTITSSEEAGIEKATRESSPDLLTLGGPCTDSEDCIATQVFEPVKCQNTETTFSGLSEKFVSVFFDNTKKDESGNNRTKAPEIVENSGDETESDLEILLDKHETVTKDNKIMENCQKFQFESFQLRQGVASSPSNDSNDSYVFELQPENTEEVQAKEKQIGDSSDSDATDCEEIEVLNPIKCEPAKPVEFEETQVLTLTPPNKFKVNTSGSTGGESPEFEIRNDNQLWSPLSLEMPSTQDMETSVKRQLEITVPKKYEDFRTTSSNAQKVEVGIESSSGSSSFWKIEPSEKKVHSPKKRSRSYNDVQVVPVKKSKIEDRLLKSRENQFSKLVRTHDIAQIQPSRTRNSVKNFEIEIRNDFPGESHTNIVHPTSRRKINTKRGSKKILNCDITPYLIKRGRPSCKGQNKETAVCENKRPKTVGKVESSTRVLRSSLRNSKSPNSLLKPLERTVLTRSSRRNSRTKKSEYFASPYVSVAFTGFESSSFDKIISELGGNKVNDLSWCGVVVADKVRRTVKFLCAIGLSLPITSPQWLISCKKEQKVLNPWDFILRDEEAEIKWDFELRTSLERSKKGKLLQGFNVFATKSTRPPVRDLLAIVECCGGTPLFEPPEVWPKKTIIVSCLEDKKFWPAAKLRNVQVVHYEFILSGVLQQKLDFKTYKLR